jgi:hypothetical protein
MDDDLRRFVEDLSDLRLKAGNPSYRKLARETHYSHTVLAQAAAGKKLPSLPVTLAFIRACDGDVLLWEQRWHRLTRTLNMAQDRSFVAPPWPEVPVADGAEPEAAHCAHDASTISARKVALDGRRLILGQIELRHCRRAHAAWARFEGFASLDNLARKREPVEIVLEILRESDGGSIEFREEYIFDYHWTNLLITRGDIFQATVEIHFDGVVVASGRSDRVVLA